MSTIATKGIAVGDVVAALELPARRGRVWGGGEARAMRAVRDHLRKPGRSMQALGYWKHDAAPEDMW